MIKKKAPIQQKSSYDYDNIGQNIEQNIGHNIEQNTEYNAE